MGLKLLGRPKFSLAFLFVGHEFSQEKILKSPQKLQALEKEVRNQFGTNKMVAKSFVSLLLGFKLRPFGLGGKMDIPQPREGRDTKSAFP